MTIITEKGLNRLAYQFKYSQRLIEFLTAFLDQYDEVNTTNIGLLNERYLDNAVGVQLDGIGEIVGLERFEYLADAIGAFGFSEDPTARGFSTLIDPSLGGNFLYLGANKALIGDDIYRTFIRMKIIKNQTAMTVDDTLRLISFAFGNCEVRYFLNENLKPQYAIGAILNPITQLMLSQLPILIGIEEVDYYLFYTDTPFSFAEDISGKGFGSLSNPNIGGNFATF